MNSQPQLVSLLDFQFLNHSTVLQLFIFAGLTVSTNWFSPVIDRNLTIFNVQFTLPNAVSNTSCEVDSNVFIIFQKSVGKLFQEDLPDPRHEKSGRVDG